MFAIGFTVVLSACGGSSGDDAATDGAVVVDAGDGIEIQLPDDFDADQSATSNSGVESEGDANDSDDATTTGATIPVTEEEETGFEGIQSAAGKLNQCLTVAGYEFIGFNDPNVPGSSDPEYLEVLSECAAEAQIAESLAEADDAVAEDPETVQQRNEGWLAFRECLIGRGWTVPEPVPDENGLLFRIADFANPDFADNFFGPNGEQFAPGGDSPDQVECQEQAAASADGDS